VVAGPWPGPALAEWGALVEERGIGEYRDHGQVRRMHITATGRALYERDWLRYRGVYADVDAAEPAAAAASEAARQL
jgi:hypothetical protein